MLLEFDADQRLWQETVRDAVTKQCPASAGPWHRRERCRSDTAVEDLRRCRLDRADRSGARGRAGDRARGAGPRHRSDPVPRDADPVRAAGRRPLRPADTPAPPCTAALPRIATPTAGCSTVRRITCSTATVPSSSRSSPMPGCSSSTPVTPPSGAARCSIRYCTSPRCRSSASHVADDRPRACRHGAGPPRRAHRHGDHHGRRVPTHPRPGDSNT